MLFSWTIKWCNRAFQSIYFLMHIDDLILCKIIQFYKWEFIGKLQSAWFFTISILLNCMCVCVFIYWCYHGIFIDWFTWASGCGATLWNGMRWCWLPMLNKYVSIGSSRSFDDDNRRWSIGQLFLRCISFRMAASFITNMDTPETCLFDTALFLEYERIFLQVII